MDNFYQNCPAKMSDAGRELGDFQTPTKRNEYIKYINDIWRDDQYRLFLQLNGKEILKKEWEFMKKSNSCRLNDCVHNFPTRSTPYDYQKEMTLYNSVYDVNTNRQYAPIRQCVNYKDYRMFNDV